MTSMHTRAANFDDLVAEGFEGTKIKFLRGIIAAISCGADAGLQAVGADDFLREHMLDDQVIANGVERIFVVTGCVGFLESFLELDVKDLEAQFLGGANVAETAREARRVMFGRAYQQANRLFNQFHAITLPKACDNHVAEL